MKNPKLDTLAAVLDHAASFAQDAYEKNGDTNYELIPMFIGIAEDGTVMPILTPFTGSTPAEAELNKERSIALVSMIFFAHGVTRYAMVSEAWIAEVTDSTDPAIAALPPSARMDRGEILQVIAADRDRAIGRSYSILRTPGDPPRLAARKDMLGEIEGRMAGILKYLPPMHPELQAMVRKMVEEDFEGFKVQSPN